MYLLAAFGCAGSGLVLALNRKPLPAVAMFIIAFLLFAGAITRHP